MLPLTRSPTPDARPRATHAGLLVVALFAAACSSDTQSRRLVEIYRPESELLRATATSIIFVPGTMGSVLIDPEADQVVWGEVWDSDTSRAEHFADLALPYDPQGPLAEVEDGLVPGGQLLAVELDLRVASPRLRVYPGLFEGIVEALRGSGSHEDPEALSMEAIEAGRSPILGFGYDWRQDVSGEAARLHAAVLAASQAREEATGDPRIDLVAHSMGTQLVRYYLRYGDQPLTEEGPLPELTWEGAQHVRRVILIAPPNRGEAQGLEMLVQGKSVSPFLPHYPPSVVASFVSCYQMLPRPGEGRVVYADGEEVDFFDVATWERYRWGPLAESADEHLVALMPGTTRAERVAKVRSTLERYLAYGRRFQRSLDRAARPPDRLGVHLIVGDTLPTDGTLVVDRQTGEVSWGAPVPGDGTVTRTSALGQADRDPGELPSIIPDSVHFVDGEHTDMVGEPNVINHLLYLLLQAPPPDGGSPIRPRTAGRAGDRVRSARASRRAPPALLRAPASGPKASGRS